jgi:hypothetical protein
VENSQTSVHALWADDASGERGIWHDLLNLLKSVPNFKIYHYGSYDRRFLDDMVERYGIPPNCESLSQRLKSDMFDVLAACPSPKLYPPGIGSACNIVTPLQPSVVRQLHQAILDRKVVFIADF